MIKQHLAALALFLSASSALAQSISIDSFTYDGSGCEQGTVAYNMSPDKLALTVLFSNFVVSTDEVSQKSCALNVALRVPAGWQYALFSLDTRGFADVEQGAAGTHASTYRFGAGPLTFFAGGRVDGPFAANYFHHNELNLTPSNWSSCASTTQGLQLNLQMGVSGLAGANALMTIDSADGSLAKNFGIRWRHCPSTDPRRRYIEAMYSDLLGRWAEEAGLNHWAQQLARTGDRVAIGMAFLNSDEHRRNEIVRAYATLLGRAASPSDVDSWARLATQNRWLTEDLTVVFASTNEFYLRAGNSPQGYVVGLYRTILGREASPTEVNHWLPTAMRDRAGLARTIVTSAESKSRLVNIYYARYLRRVASAREVQAWVAQMTTREAQETVQAKIMASDEYYNLPR